METPSTFKGEIPSILDDGVPAIFQITAASSPESIILIISRR